MLGHRRAQGQELGVAGRRHQLRVQQVGQQLDPVHQARAGVGEGGAGVDRVDASGAERLDLLPVLHRLRLGVCGGARRHHHDDLGAEALELAPDHLGRVQPGVAGDVLAPGDRDHLGDPEAGDAGRVEALERDHPRRRRAGEGGADRRQAPLEFAAQLVGVRLHARGLAKADHLFQHLAERRNPHFQPISHLGAEYLRPGSYIPKARMADDDPTRSTGWHSR